MKLLISTLALVMLSVACGGGGSSAAPTAPSPPAAQNPAPDTLQATWTVVTNTTDASNVLVTLILSETRYVVSSPGHLASGSIAVQQTEQLASDSPERRPARTRRSRRDGKR